ncbi:MAG TPA: GH3 auxin-responsive promoter family protein [Burkholderiales bacterium]|nr:GH3 auxin-responsive promoter family protein [Burkholderiales bacterium]
MASAWRASAFAEALDDVQAAQRRVLERLLAGSARTEYGRSLRLGPETGIDEFRERTPIVDYAALEPWIERQRASGGAVLTPGRVRCYEPTSGSGGRAKRIPYNDAMLASFRALFAIWAHDLFTQVLQPRSGRTFMSLSSPMQDHGGFADDREYLGPLSRALIGRFLIMPPRLAPGGSPGAWRDALACALVACADLEIISVWNPSYLLILLEHFEEHRLRLAPALPPARRAALADELQWTKVWPALQLISCWRDGAAAAAATRLAELFPQAKLQGKGLVATEAPLTVPLTAAGGCAPLVDEVFLELDAGGGKLRLLHETELHAQYDVVLSQAGGLLRYRLGDRVQVSGFHRGAPLFSFAGRADGVADLVGEKLDEALVAQALDALAQPGAFCTLLPILPERGRPYYRLLTDDPRPELAPALDAALMQALRYREARLLGQLDPVQATRGPDIRRAVHDALIATGMKAGDIKDRALISSLEHARRVSAQLSADQRAPV